MRSLRTLLLAALAATTCRAGFFENLFHHDVVVITSTDLTDEGKKIPPPTQKNPIYYVALNVGYHDFGGMIAGDKLPPSDKMLKVIAKVLAKEGYLPATTRHPPTQLIAFAWGTMYSTTIPSMDPSLPDVQLNRAQKLKFLGGEKMGLYDPQGAISGSALTSTPDLAIQNPDQQMITDMSQEDLYVAAITGFDYQALARTGKPVPLWRTRISCPSLGLSMDETLPTMIAIASPYVGHETAKPVWADASDKYQPEVKIGDAKLEEYIDSGKVPVLTAPEKGRPKKGN